MGELVSNSLAGHWPIACGDWDLQFGQAVRSGCPVELSVQQLVHQLVQSMAQQLDAATRGAGFPRLWGVRSAHQHTGNGFTDRQHERRPLPGQRLPFRSPRG